MVSQEGSKEGIVLDPEAQRIFEQLGGTESWKGLWKDQGGADCLARSLLAEQQRQDAIRLALARLIHLTGHYLASEKFALSSKAEDGAALELSAALGELAAVPGHLGAAFIRYRGASADPGLPDKFDYEAVIGNTTLDMTIVPRIVRRSGSDQAKLPEQLLHDFTILAEYGVNNLYFRLPENLPLAFPDIRKCLKILSAFRSARNSGRPMTIHAGGQEATVAVVNDENLYPDPNLTLLAGLNRISMHSMEMLVEKVDAWLRRQDKEKAQEKYAGVYNAALQFPKVKAQLKSPPVELNNIKWLLSSPDNESMPLEKVYIARLAMEIGGASPQKVAKLIQSVYGDDYARISSEILGERLHLSSDLLHAAEKSSEKAELDQEVLTNLQARLDQVKDHVLDQLEVREDTGIAPQDRPAAKGVVHSNIYRMVSFYKGRSATHKKMVGMVHRSIVFEDRDFDILAKDFKIPREEAELLVRKLKECFGQDGAFKKAAFNDAIPHFRQYESKIFGFLWHHMKDAILPQDRVPFLNALQTLTARMHQPKRALKVLLEDICGDPEKVLFSDNKAVMLANLIVHRPDKALADYEITPEEVILNRRNLDPEAVEYASWRIDKDKEQFLTKVQTIHKKQAESMSVGRTAEKIPATVMLNLERELYIFLALTGGETCKAILRSAVQEYGDSNAGIYRCKESLNLLAALLQNLRIVLRGLGATGGMGDIDILTAVKAHEEAFQRLKNDRQHRAQARMISEWVDEAVKLVKFRA